MTANKLLGTTVSIICAIAGTVGIAHGQITEGVLFYILGKLYLMGGLLK